MSAKKKTPTVYLVTKGCYSSYHVIAAFSTRALAKEFMATIPENGYYGYNDIEEYELDPPAARLLREGWSVWYVHMLRDGTVEKVGESEASDAKYAGQVGIWKRSTAPAYRGKGVPDVMTATVWARDEKHAVKIVNEYRTEWIASNKWKAPA